MKLLLMTMRELSPFLLVQRSKSLPKVSSRVTPPLIVCGYFIASPERGREFSL